MRAAHCCVVALLGLVLSASVVSATFDASSFAGNIFYLFGDKGNLTNTEAIHLIRPGEAAPSSGDLLVTVVYNESFTDKGWDFLQVTPSSFFWENATTTRLGYFYGGIAEAMVTAQKLLVYFGNHPQHYSDKAAAWVATHLTFVDNKIAYYTSGQGASSTTQEALFWRQTGNQMEQLRGLALGMRSCGLPNTTSFSFEDMFRFNFRYEIGDINNAVSTSSDDADVVVTPRNLHCSALVKVTANDIFFSHDTWGGFDNMIRQYKVYQFQVTVSLSGFAGQIHSGDDWYVTSNQLASQETTNEYFGAALAKEFIVPQCNSEFMRVMVANYLANDSKTWTELFGTWHSGTYCNQYMVIDYKLYTPGNQGNALQDNLLWVVEEMPGNVTAADVTQVLRNTSYWASYNIPYFHNIYVNSGFQAQEEAIGDFFSYTKYARPEIFKRNQGNVTDLESMKHMMQYNEWTSDPLSYIPNCTVCSPHQSPLLVIAARGDLVPTDFVPPTNPNYAAYLGRGAFGAIDSKIASYAMMQQSMSSAVFCGPTPQQPTFSWKQAFNQTPPSGAVDSYTFSWEGFNVVNVTGLKPAIASTAGNPDHSLAIGLVLGVPIGVIAAFLVIRHLTNKKPNPSGEYRPV